MYVPGLGPAVLVTWKLDRKGTETGRNQKQIDSFILTC